MGADDRRHRGVPAEHHRAADRLRLDPHVVVEQLHEVAALRARVSTMARAKPPERQIGLAQHLEGVAETLGDRG